MLLMFRELASRFVRLSRSCWVKGPLGFCNASRRAAFKPGSGMDTSCANTEPTWPATTETTKRVK